MAEGNGDKKEGGLGSNWLSPWVGGTGAVISLLTLCLSAFVKEESAKQIAVVVAIGVALLSAAFEYRRRRHRPPPAKAPPPPLETSLLRLFLPFEQGDVLIGRRGDVADALAILQNSDFRFGVIWGESGCGKTSFLRAGLVPELRRRGHTAVYLNRPGADPVDAIERALHAGAGAATPARAFVIVDQFEEYFLTHAHHQPAGALGPRLQALLAAHPPSAVVIAIRRDFFARLQNLAPHVPDPTSPRTTFELANLRTAAARDVLVQAAADEAVQFEAALVDAIIEDLEADGEVWPVELQLIGTRLKRARVHQKAGYIALGRRSGVIGTFIRAEVARLSKPLLGEIVLRKLCAPGGIAKSPVDITLQALADDVRARDPTLATEAELATCLRMLQDARIVIQTGDDTFNLTHDALAPLIQRGTTGLQGRTEAADRSISFYLDAFRNDRKVRIPLRTLLQIRRDATPQALADNQVRALVAKSWRSTLFTASWPASLAIAVLLAIGYGLALTSWSIGTERATFSSGPPSIAIRTSGPYTRFLPGMDKVSIETHLRVDELDAKNPTVAYQVPRGEIWGFIPLRKSVQQIANTLEPLDKIAFLRTAGQPQAAAATFAASIGDKEQKNALFLKFMANAIGLTGRANRNDVTNDIMEIFVRVRAATPANQVSAKLAANLGMLRIAENRAGMARHTTLTLPQALAILGQQIVASQHIEIRDPSWETLLTEAAIGQLLLNGAAPPTESDLTALEIILDDTRNDPFARVRVYAQLETYAARNDALAGPVLQYLLRTALARTSEPDWLTLGAMRIIPPLVHDHPSALRQASVAAQLKSSLLDTPGDKMIDAWAIALSLLGRPDPAALPATFVKALQAGVENADTPDATRAVAAIALSHLASGDPRLRNDRARREVVDLLRNTAPGDKGLQRFRRQAAAAAADLAVAGQLDAESIQIVLRSLGQTLTNTDAALSPSASWGDDDFDASLMRLVVAGGQIDTPVLDAIVAAVAKPHFSGGESEAADMLIAAAQSAPQSVLERGAKLDSIGYRSGFSQEFDRPLRLKIVAAFGQADAAMSDANAPTQRCKRALATPSNAETWQRGAFCVFFSTLAHPETLSQWKAELTSMLKKGLGHQMAARMTLEMLVDAQRVADAVSNPALVALTRARLRYDLEDREAHIAIAARASMLALDAAAHR